MSSITSNMLESNDLKQAAVKRLPNTMNYSFILTSTEMQKIYALGGFSSGQEFNLLYRATRDGFSAADFHSKCDGYLNTLTIVKSSNGYVFGGFTTRSWIIINCSSGCFSSDSSAFILSLRRNVTGFNAATHARRFNVTQTSYAIDSYDLYGPTFGGSSDFHVADMSNMNNNSYSKFGDSYQYPSEFTAQSFNASNYLTGCTIFDDNNKQCHFSTVEVEVYKLL
jgi:hypothetical protein